MDSLLDSDYAMRSPRVSAIMPPPRAPRWVAVVGLLTIGLAAAAILCATLLFAQSVSSPVAAAAALVLAIMALGCGIAAVVGRRVHGAVIGKVDLLNQALATTANAQLIVGRGGQTVYANAAFADFFPGLVGAPLDALQRRLVAGGGSVGDLASLRRDLEQKGHASGRVAIAHPAGRLAWFSISAHRLAGPEGASLWSLEDITERNAIDQEMRDERAALADFLDHAPVGFYSADGAGRFVFINAAFAEWLGASAAELVEQGAKLSDFLAEPQSAGTASPNQQGRGEIMLKSRNGRIIHALITQNMAEAGSGQRTHAMVRDLGREHESHQTLAPSRDTTDRKKIEAQSAQSQKMQAVGQLAGGVAHDFNNLLTAMIGFCDLLLQQHGPGDRSFPDLMQIKQNANRAANLVRQLLAFSRQQTLQPRVLNITDALADLSHLLRRLIGENIALNVVHGRDLGLIKVDQGQLEQVIINLAVNARDAMQGGGTLTIKTENVELKEPIRRGDELMPAGQYVVIAVGDTGCGIPKENLERIFEPFFSTKELGAGTGLGLSTVYGIVKQTGGFVLVDSEAGKGATFSIYLPRHEGEEEGVGTSVARAGEEAVLAKDLTGAGTVLLVEDEDPVRLFSARALKNKGYKVIEAESAERALEILHDGADKIDLVITDVVMPKMDGPSLIKEVRELYPDRALKVIFMSGYTEDNFRKRLGDEIDIHFLPKPFSLKQLAGKVKEVMAEGD